MKSSKGNPSKNKSSSIGLIRRFAVYYKKYIPTLSLDLFCAALTTLCELALPLIVRKITDVASTDISKLSVSLILICAGIYVALKIIDTAAYYYMSSVGHIMGTKIETDMRRDFFSHLQTLSFSYYDNTKVGTLMSRITSDLFDITEFAHHCPEEFFIAGIKIIVSFIILCLINIPMTLITFSMLPIMVVVLVKANHRLRADFKESRHQVGELNAQIEDSLLGIHEVKSFSNEAAEEKKFEQGNLKFLKIKEKVYRSMGKFGAMSRFFDGLIYITVVVAGAFFLRAKAINAADFIAYLLYVTTLIASVRRIVEFAEQFQRGLTGIERFAEVMDIEPDITDSENAKDIGDVSGDIEFDNVSFRYSDDSEHNVLKSISVHIKAGENIALVGPSGGGKTTFCSLITRFYDITDGAIKVDGVDIRDITIESLRKNIGVVRQDVYMFSGSIRDNIEYGKPGATDEEIMNAAILAGAHEFISELPNGYDTYVGERGVKLSGGQKQRISIARVFLKDPPVLILDEATSALDNESEHIVQQSLERLAHGRTTLTIAHRLTTVRNADRIIVLTADGIAETGSHEELIKKGGIYANLYKMYTVS